MIVYILVTDDGPLLFSSPILLCFHLTCSYLRPTMSSSIPANMDLAALVTIGVSRVHASYIIKMMLISRVQSI
jgi:hypothetical protein